MAAPLPRRLHDHWTVVQGRPLYARVARATPDPALATVILVHGAFISSRYMVPAASRLAPHYNVYAPDLPGYGKSARLPRVPSVAGFAELLSAWMDAVGLARAAFIGNSFGCQIIAAVGARHLARITQAILVGPTVDPQHHTLVQQAGRLLLDGTREPLHYLPLLLGDCRRIGLRAGVQLVRVVLQDHIEEVLPQLQVPTLVVRGARDPLVPQGWAEEATRLLPSARLAVIPGAAHVAQYAAPAAFVALAQAFLGT
jgi:2-hydroxy-6-oxonona-2,4-dienedioate hydrolase